MPDNNEKSMFGEVQISQPASYNNFINSAFMCTKAGRWREGWMSCVNMTYSLTPTSKSASPIFLPSRHSGEQEAGFPLQTAQRLSRWIVFCQMTSLSWLAISLCEKWLGRQEVQLTAFGSHLGNKYLSPATPLTSLILAPSVSQWLSVGTECSRVCLCVCVECWGAEGNTAFSVLTSKHTVPPLPTSLLFSLRPHR